MKIYNMQMVVLVTLVWCAGLSISVCGMYRPQQAIIDKIESVNSFSYALMMAVGANDLKTVQTLLAAKAEVNQADEDGVTPLYIAAQNGFEDIARCLIEAGANPHLARKSDGITPLYIAAQNGFEKIVDSLIKVGADLNRDQKNDGITPLYIATQNGFDTIVARLVNAKADVNTSRKSDGVTPLYVAAQNGCEAIVSCLMGAKADVSRGRTSDGVTPLDVATKMGHEKVVGLLQQILIESLSGSDGEYELISLNN